MGLEWNRESFVRAFSRKLYVCRIKQSLSYYEVRTIIVDAASAGSGLRALSDALQTSLSYILEDDGGL